MKSNKKGFTLIELLAVIVILAIIALIATPIILNIVQKARKSAAEDSVYGVMKAVQLAYATSILDTNALDLNTYVVTCRQDGCKYPDPDPEKTGDLDLVFSGTKPTAGTFQIDPATGKMKATQNIEVNGFYCEITANEKVNCQTGAFTTSGGAADGE